MTQLTLDHIVIAVRDLETSTANYRRLLGRAPSWRGKHPTYGTANVLFRLDNTYIELIAPGGDANGSPWAAALREQLDTAGDGLYAVALGTDGIERAVADARAGGLRVSDPAAGDGVDLESGAKRAWRNARIEPESTRAVRAFFIQHDSPPDALPVAAPEAEDGSYATAVDHTVIASSDLSGTLALWNATLGIELRTTIDRQGGRALHFLRFAEGSGGYGSILELAGEQQPARPGASDALWGVSYRVGDVTKAVERLRAHGVNVSDARAGNAPGTIVADLKPGFSHDVRTLLIQKEAR